MKSATELNRLDRLLDVAGELLRTLDLDELLDTILERSRELTDAKYAAIGVLDREGREFGRFLTSGMSEEVRAVIGAPPRGLGVLGLLTGASHPMRIDDIGAHPGSYGFASGHPPMTTFLGAPLVIDGEQYGSLYLTEKQGGPFTDGDEATVAVLAPMAATAIGNARRHGELVTLLGELTHEVRLAQINVEIAQALAGEIELGRILELIVKRGRALLDVRSLMALLLESGYQVVAAVAGTFHAGTVGTRFRCPKSLYGEAFERTPQVMSLSEYMATATEQSPEQSHSPLGSPEPYAALKPLIHRERPIGMLVAIVTDRQAAEAVVEPLDALAASATLAIVTGRAAQRAFGP